MSDKLAFQELQYKFAAHLRDPDHVAAPAGIEDRRIGIYRELFYNNIQSLLAGTFPILRKILSDQQWHRLIRNYFHHHESHTPLFLEMPQEFISYLQEEHKLEDDEPAFILELAHYEWAELAVSILEDEPDLDGIDPRGDLIDGVPVISPTCWSLARWGSATRHPPRPWGLHCSAVQAPTGSGVARVWMTLDWPIKHVWWMRDWRCIALASR